MKHLFRILILLGIAINIAHAQSTVQGTVYGADDKQPLPFVTVAVYATTNGTITDVAGKFSLQSVKTTDTIIFSFVGYETLRLPAQLGGNMQVYLTTNRKQLGEVVVTALGVSRQKRELGYATEKIGGNEIQQSNAPNIINALSGKAAGVQVTNPDGVDGGTTRITIRGNNSIDGNNQPLIVIDGMPMNNDPGLTDIGRGRDWGSAINNINMADVEDINVLKGGAASALYGSRGANGVILITTRKGRKHKGIGASYTMMYKTMRPFRYREVQNKYGGGAPRADLGSPDFEYGSDSVPMTPSLSTDPKFGYPGTAVSWGPAYNGEYIRWWDGKMRAWEAQPDNLRLPFRNGQNVMHNVSVEGAGDAGSMRFSFSRNTNTPIIYNSNFSQTTISTNTTMKVTDKVTLGLALSYALFDRLNSPLQGDDANSINKALLYSWPRSYLGEDLDAYALSNGTQNPNIGYPYNYIDNNIWWNYFNNNTTLNRNKLIGGLTLNYNISKWLSLSCLTGLDNTSDEYETKNKPTDLIGLQDGYYAQQLQRDRSVNGEWLLTAKKDSLFRKPINVSWSLGGSSWSRNMQNVRAQSGRWYFPNWYSLSNFTPTIYGTDADGNVTVASLGDDPATLLPVTNFYRKRINSFYSFMNVSLHDYLFLQVTGRNDWSSTLPQNANSYFYPGASLSFILSDALKWSNKILSFCKVRGGAAQTATDTDPYQTEFYYKTSLYGGQQASSFPAVIPPISLKPQRVNSYEIGTSLGFFKDFITLDLTYYYKYAFDQIIRTPVPTSAGAATALINEGIISNKGVEIILNATVIQRNNFSIKTGLNYARNRNTVVSLGDYADTYILADIWGENGPQIALQEGDDFGTIVGWDYVYKDEKPVVSDDGTRYLLTPTRVPVGNASPLFIGGWNTAWRYRSLTLSTLIDTKWGGDIYSGSYVTGLQTGQSPATLEERDGGGLPYTDANGNITNTGVILEGVHADGTPNTTVVNYIYKYMPNAGGWGNFLTKPGIVENTWVKFREVTLAWQLPARMVQRTRVLQDMSIAFTARDLFYIYTTLPDNINPEGTIGAGNAQGLEWGALPGVRSFTVSINARF
ncbi:MAG: SusC/RagA family TonB-linked outer membrane protein [Bacteroidetes bacterium]|nr:SusC/RagA family TonB-linked outer membrane protein [Bacteroidota bacterium]